MHPFHGLDSKKWMQMKVNCRELITKLLYILKMLTITLITFMALKKLNRVEARSEHESQTRNQYDKTEREMKLKKMKSVTFISSFHHHL